MAQMKKTTLLICMLGIALIGVTSACSRSYSREEIYEQFGSGVVLVANEYYFGIAFGGEELMWFSHFSRDGSFENLADDRNLVEPQYILGAGFFVSDDGRILTTNYNVDPMFNNETFISDNEYLKKVLRLFSQSTIKKCDLKIDSCCSSMTADLKYDAYAEIRDTLGYYVNKRKKMRSLIDSMEQLSFAIIPHSTITILNSAVEGSDTGGMHPCQIIDTDAEQDLALLQLTDGATPSKCTIFSIPKKDEALSEGQTLYLIGYNSGTVNKETFAASKPQLLSGEIVKSNDSKRLKYMIPYFAGLSGGPIIDEYGQLAAINGTNENDSSKFNTGLKVKYIPVLWIK